jgi:recombination protein RecT
MSIQTDKSGQIQKREPSKADNLAELLRTMLPEIKRALPKHVDPERMLRIAVTAVRQSPDLALCTAASFVGCVMQAAQLGLEPNTPLGLAYLIPRKSKKLDAGQRECTLIIGYQGQLDLSRRSGLVGPVYAHVVREGDAFEYGLGTDTYIKHRPSDDPAREEKQITHAYAVAKGRESSQECQFVVLTRAQIEARRKRSAAADEGPWITDLEAMCCKSAARALWKWLPKSAEMARAEAIEDAADRGVPITAAFDPTVAEAMVKGGLIEDAEIVDPATGEVKPATPQNGNGEHKAS